ncbi:MAG: DUF805 domain-containing protein [Hyphomicrobium sp.]
MSDIRPIDFFDPRGRVNRIGLIAIAAVMVGAQGGVYVSTYLTNYAPFPEVHVAMNAVFAWISYVSISKRIHDLGYGAGRMVLGAIAIAVASVLVAIVATAVLGEDAMLPGGVGYLAVASIVFVPVIAAVVWLHCAPGVKGSNRFGPEPGATGFSRHHASSRPITASGRVSAASALATPVSAVN